MDSTEETNFNASEHGGRTAVGQEGRTGGPRGRDGGEGGQIVGQECQNGGEDDGKKSGQTVEVDVQEGQVEDDGAEVGGQDEDGLQDVIKDKRKEMGMKEYEVYQM